MTLGELGVSIAEGAMGAGMADENICMVRSIEDLNDAARTLWQYLRPNDVVLLKASRAVAAERMVDALRRTCPN
jgi:UDP-N-acetylmuramyl pentapeptide synthase